MTKKLFLLISVLVIASVVLVACGGNETPAPTEPPAEVPAEEPTEAPMEEPTEAPMEEPTEEAAEEPTEPVATLRIWADDTRSPILSALADDFMDAYNVEIIVEEVADIRDQFTIAAPAGEGPDITIIPHDQAASLVASGLLAPIDLGDKTSMFVPGTLDAATYDGVLYGMPYATENLGFFYNTDLVSEPPATWDEVLEIGGQLQDEGKATYALALSGTTYDAYPIFTAFGGYIFGRDDAGNWNPEDLGIDSPGMIAAAQWMQDAVNAGLMSDSTDWDTAHVLFETGEVPFLMAGPWALDRIRESGIPYAITNFPAAEQEGYPFSGVQIFVINAFSENTLLAQAFLTEFVATEEVMKELYIAGNRPSAFQPVLDATDDPDLLAMGQAGHNATPMPAIPEMGSVWGSWNDAITLILQGEQTPEEALTTAAEQIRALIGGAKLGMVNVPGSWQAAAGVCEGDWDPACDGSALIQGEDGLYTASFELPAGDYEVKVALDGSWTTNYGVDGAQDGDNYKFTMAADGTVTFTYDPETHILTIETE
jgi:maltose/maltodextrin transport system substrate-binding protein/arabinogalactan oligomer/maltooligosaccharide transport system substrate-binding protein